MRKIKAKYENDIDNFFIEISEILSPYFKKLNMTANDITTLSLIFGLISIYYLYIDSYNYSALFYLISHLFDVMDGYYARKYKITSKFGDLYDHFKDIIVGILLYSLLIYKIYYHNSDYLIYYLIIIIVSFINMNIYLGCQENISNKNKKINNHDENFLDFHKYLCKDNPKQKIQFFKYFGCGSFILIISLLIISIQFICHKN
jgi:phosphatidylglycerophosphate synthase